MEQAVALIGVRQALLGVIAAITQTPSDSANKMRLASNVALAKTTGFVATSTMFGLVSAFGTAGTGTAIGSLSGAAATNATLAWIGGLVGGGMAAGAMVLPVVGVAAGTAAVMVVRRKWGDRPRKIDELLPFEEEILFCADSLLRPLDKLSEPNMRNVSAAELQVYAHDGLMPLIKRLNAYLPEGGTGKTIGGNNFSKTLVRKYQKKLRQHVVALERCTALLPKKKFRRKHKQGKSLLSRLWDKITGVKPTVDKRTFLGSVVIATAFQCLLSENYSQLTREHDLVLDALRRSTGSLGNATNEELSAYLKDLSPEQLQGVVSNTKGIYHEMLFVEMYNAANQDSTALLMDTVNAPGADVQIFAEGDVIKEIQLKTVTSPSAIHEHLKNYPDIEILVNEEMAAVLDGIGSSGLNNAVLTRDVTERLYELQDSGLLSDVTDTMLNSAFVVTSVLVYRSIVQRSGEKLDYTNYLKNAGIAIGTTSLIGMLTSSLGN